MMEQGLASRVSQAETGAVMLAIAEYASTASDDQATTSAKPAGLGETALRSQDRMSPQHASTVDQADTAEPPVQGAPIIDQSPTVTVGDKTFVILPGPVANISARNKKRS
jgi:hypothetical protein